MIALRVALCASGFAEHIVAVGIALCFHLGCAFHRADDGLSQNKLTAHFFHRAAYGCADDRLAQALHRASERADDARSRLVEHLAREHERPRGRVDQWRGAFAEVAGPIRLRYLVFNERINRFGIGHTQERFGKTHERDALVGGKAVFREEHFHHPRIGTFANAAHQSGSVCRNALPRFL